MKTGISRVAAAIGWMFGPCLALAGSATWSQNPASSEWNEASNWMPATVPNGPADVATFGQSTLTAISITAVSFPPDEEVSGITFNSGASAFTITVSEEPGDGALILTFRGAGIVNNSGITQNFLTKSNFSGHGQLRFKNTATAGNSTVFTNNGGDVANLDAPTAAMAFLDASTAGNGTFINSAGTVIEAVPGFVTFDDNSLAGHGAFMNNGATTSGDIIGANTSFSGNASADHGSFLNKGAAASPDRLFNAGYTAFYDSASAGEGIFTSSGGLGDLTLGGGTLFYHNSTAANGEFTNNGGEVSGASGGTTMFRNSAIAGNGVFTSNGSAVSGGFGGVTIFHNNSSAGNGRFVNNQGLGGGSAGLTLFYDNAQANQGDFSTKGGSLADQAGGYVRFYGSSTAANGTFTNDGGTGLNAIGGFTTFRENSMAANAVLIANGGLNGGLGGQIQLEANSTGGTARVVLSGNGFLTISAHNLPGVTIGSLEGNGSVLLGSINLTIGSRNDDTVFSGVIQDGGSLTKIGTGTLTLAGANTYAGPTTVSGGELLVNGSIMSAVTVNSSGTLGGSGTTGSVTVQSGGTVAPASSQTLHINGNYAQNAGGILKIEVASASPNASSKLDITGSATLDGTLEVRFLNGLLPITGRVIEILHAGGALAGSFAQIIFPRSASGFPIPNRIRRRHL
jgi:autotransporter-associated beta strand protein